MNRLAVMTMAAIAALALACDDNFEESYATAGDARKAGAYDRGWIPADVPDSATNLRERHNIDTNEVAGIFHIPVGESQAFLARLSKLDEDESVRGPRIHPEPWPETLTRKLIQQHLREQGIQLGCDTARRLFAVNTRTGEVHYWSVSP